MSFGKLLKPSLDSSNGADVLASAIGEEGTENCALIWITGNLAGQDLPMMIDTGATPNCVSLRCVSSASDILKELPRKLYDGSNIIDANGQPLQPEFTIQCNLTMGTQKFSINCEFLVLEALPISCILGQNTFSKFSSWNISNLNKIITINNESKLPYLSSPSSIECLQLITTNKVCLNSYKSMFVEGRITGSAVSAFRPVTHVPVVIEGNNELTNNLLIKVIPAICRISRFIFYI